MERRFVGCLLRQSLCRAVLYVLYGSAVCCRARVVLWETDARPVSLLGRCKIGPFKRCPSQSSTLPPHVHTLNQAGSATESNTYSKFSVCSGFVAFVPSRISTALAAPRSRADTESSLLLSFSKGKKGSPMGTQARSKPRSATMA